MTISIQVAYSALALVLPGAGVGRGTGGRGRPVGHQRRRWAIRCGAMQRVTIMPSQGVLEPAAGAGPWCWPWARNASATGRLDLGRAPTRHAMAAIRKQVKTAAAVEHVFLVASHTHHGPVLELDTLARPEEAVHAPAWNRSSWR